MLNKHGGKVRLTFKLEADQLWLSTKERTEKLSMGTIKNVVSEPIEDHEEYHIMVCISICPWFSNISHGFFSKIVYLMVNCVTLKIWKRY